MYNKYRNSDILSKLPFIIPFAHILDANKHISSKYTLQTWMKASYNMWNETFWSFYKAYTHTHLLHLCFLIKQNLFIYFTIYICILKSCLVPVGERMTRITIHRNTLCIWPFGNILFVILDDNISLSDKWKFSCLHLIFFSFVVYHATSGLT